VADGARPAVPTAGEEWQGSWDAFLGRLASVLAAVPDRPPRATDAGTYVLQNGKGEAIWLVSPPDVPGSPEWQLEHEFSGRELNWELVVDGVAVDGDNAIVSFKPATEVEAPGARALAARIREFYAAVPGSDPAARLAPNQRVRVRGTLTKTDPLGGITLLHGVGPETGKCALCIKIHAAHLEPSRPGEEKPPRGAP
jgi:hypothetical protein